MSTTGKSTSSFEHPRPLDRNKSIIWARYKVDSTDWLLMSIKLTRLSTGNEGAAPALASFAIVDCAGKTVLEALVRVEEMIDSHMISLHGVTQSVLFNARNYSDVKQEIEALSINKDILVWSRAETEANLLELDSYYKHTPNSLRLADVSSQYARFCGVKDGINPGYQAQPLTRSGISAVSECLDMRKAIVEMASSSQANHSLENDNPGWTAEFYKPKLTPKDKIKGIFGIR